MSQSGTGGLDNIFAKDQIPDRDFIFGVEMRLALAAQDSLGLRAHLLRQICRSEYFGDELLHGRRRRICR